MMTKTRNIPSKPLFLGIEGGGTRTVSLLADAEGRVAARIETGPANLRLLGERQLVQHFSAIAARLLKPSAMAIGMAGVRGDVDKQRIRRVAAAIWPGVPCCVTNDLETALLAAGKPSPAGERNRPARVLVLCGTGSCCFGRTSAGRTAKIGGWGHILGDKGSAYEIGLRALKAVVYYHDLDRKWPKLGQRLLRKLQFNEPDDLIGWVQNAAKDEVAGLATEVFDAWKGGDKIAGDILEGAAHGLANDAIACARQLTNGRVPVQFVLAGGVLLRQPRFARKVALIIRKLRPKAVVTPLKRESVWGSVELAKRLFLHGGGPAGNGAGVPRTISKIELPPLESLRLSPTEQRNPRSMRLDKLPIADAIKLMLSEDGKIPPAIFAERKKIEHATRLIVRAFKRDGRLLYVGAGTSGRLGVLDASECPPTFRTPPELVQGVIAGGRRALWEAVEGVEDDPLAGARAIQFRRVNRKDVVVGIAASGRTPFVWGALREAAHRGANTILLCFNPRLKLPRRNPPNLVIAPDIGPEVLTGSTRLKAGTATKLILNMFTTLALARMGRLKSNLMVDVDPANAKLRDRAARIVRELTGVDEAAARKALATAGWVVKKALRRLRGE